MSEQLTWQKDGVDWPNRFASRFVEAAGITWHVQVMENHGQAVQSGCPMPCAVLVHGTGSSTHSWAGLAPLLAERMSVVAMDLPGHAFTPQLTAGGMTLPGMASAVRELIVALGVEPVLAVGHSAGAAILARMCIDGSIAPRSFLSLNGALLPFRGCGSRLFPPLARLLAGSSILPALFARHASRRSAVERLIEGTGSKLSPRSIDFYARLVSCRAHVTGALAMMAAWDLEALVADLPRLAVPLTLVAGGNDRTLSSDEAFEVAALVAGSRCIYLREFGHLAHEEAPEEIAKIAIQSLPAIVQPT